MKINSTGMLSSLLCTKVLSFWYHEINSWAQQDIASITEAAACS